VVSELSGPVTSRGGSRSGGEERTSAAAAFAAAAHDDDDDDDDDDDFLTLMPPPPRPFWLSPRQMLVVPVDKALNAFAETVRVRMHHEGFFVDTDDSGRWVGLMHSFCAAPSHLQACFAVGSQLWYAAPSHSQVETVRVRRHHEVVLKHRSVGADYWVVWVRSSSRRCSR
jgi:hypothetical protein